MTVTIETLKELQDRSRTFVGMKHAVNDLDFASGCFGALGRDFKLFVGLEELSFPMMARRRVRHHERRRQRLSARTGRHVRSHLERQHAGRAGAAPQALRSQPGPFSSTPIRFP